MRVTELTDRMCSAQSSCCCVISVPLLPIPSVTQDGTHRHHECAVARPGLGSGWEPQSPALVLGGQGVLWQVPLRTHLYSGFCFPSPWGVDEQLGTCALERGPTCPSLCTGVLWPSSEEASRGRHGVGC